ncbi:CBS domain-containing protein [Methanoplanus sp. FWC-SCC4]|uniref:CBS domain-containing protein n=1 Tax=Methanochimaera problematica TaxID=2609417 RepID=A0AA97I249_9EURY|nr:homocysteine biosynthesis protein [Methanoplanus sp. FWC-SCC4]WOF15885.1 CBS domain-containing protein [Methanoplanus sp. FWC-SCC4]
MEKSIEEINLKIRNGNARVVTAEDMPDIVAELGEEGALKEVDVVTTGTFGAMCSSGAFFNFGHADPPIRMERAWLNDVEVYSGIAAVDAYLGATQESEILGNKYGGAHVIEDLISGKSVELRASAKGTDCYPRKTITTELLLEDMNQATMCNPRNAYQRYAAATNSTENVLHTYMGTLLPGFGNLSYSGAGCLSPLINDPKMQMIGSGVPIFLCGAKGMVIGQGTQSSPANLFATLMTTGDLKEMSPDFLRAATFTGYGVSMYLGIGVPIPVTNLDVVRNTSVRDEDIITPVVDYGVPSRNRPTVREITYAELKSGMVELNGEEVRTSSLSSFKKARQVASELKCWIEKGEMELCLPTRKQDISITVKPMKESREAPAVREIMNTNVNFIKDDEDIKTAAKKLLRDETNHLPVLNNEGKVVGIVTTYDISKAVVKDGTDYNVSDIMSKNVVTTTPSEAVDIAAMKLERNNISALPVVDKKGQLAGLLTAIDLGKLFGARWRK